MFKGVDDVWLLTEMHPPRAPENSMNAVWAARQAGVERVVRMSAIGAAHDAPSRNGRLHAMADHQLRESGLSWTIVRPHAFMQNLLWQADRIAGEGVFALNMSDGRIGMVDSRDVADLVAHILRAEPDRYHGRIYTPSGPVTLTYTEVAEQLGQVLGRKIRYMAASPEEAHAGMVQSGISNWLAGMLVEYGLALGSGFGDYTTNDVEQVLGRPPRSFAEFARDHAAAFTAARRPTRPGRSSGQNGRVRIGMLGPLEVRDGGDAHVPVSGERLRRLLITLALARGRVVSTADLIDGVWGDDPPAGAANALQALVSRLRRTLPELVVESGPGGYRLVLDPDSVDVTRFEQLVAAGRAELTADPARARDTLNEALALWRGPALLDVADAPRFHAPAARLDELRLAAAEDRFEAELRLGRGSELISELTALVAEHPLRERLIGTLMRALSQAGRPAEALIVYERTRAMLADDLGTDPSPELSAVHTAVLRGEVGPQSPPVVTMAASTTLPAALTSFVGRETDVVQVGELVRDYRLTTLVGPGGSGKTRLAVEAARSLRDAMRDGVWLVELASVTDAAGVPGAAMSTLGLRDQPTLDRPAVDHVTDRIAGALRTRTALIVLDNCEHVIDAAAKLSDRLLRDCPGLRILATSREPLAITGEAVWPVGPLGLPPSEAQGTDIAGSAAVRLLVDRARAARPGFTVTAANAAAVAQVCRALDGMPLAIELAAARLRTMTAQQLAGRIDDRFRLLTGGSRTALPRHQTLRAVVDWSWELLSVPEQALLRRLSVFPGGATLDAAIEVCGDDTVDADHILDLLTGLVDKSLLMVSGAEPPRYRMLETIAAYGRERLDEAGERDSARRAHARYFVELAETAEPYLRRAEQLVWLRRLEADHDNLNAALRSAVAARDAQLAVRLVAAAGWYWWLSGHKAEGIELAKAALDVPGKVDNEARATACVMIAYFMAAGLADFRQADEWIRTAGLLARRIPRPNAWLRYAITISAVMRGVYGSGEVDLAGLERLIADEDPWVRAQTRLARHQLLGAAEREADMATALAEFRSIGERWGISYSLSALAGLVARRGDFTRAIDYGEQALVVLAEIGAVEDLVLIRSQHAQLSWLNGDVAGAAAAIEQAEREAEQVGWPDALAGLAYCKGELARWAGDYPTARAELVRADNLMRHTVVDGAFRAMTLDSLGHLDAAEGELEAARASRSQAFAIAVDASDQGLIGQILVGIADQAVRQGSPAAAARLLAASEQVGGGPDKSRPDAARVEAAARAALDGTAFDDARRGAPGTTEAIRELAASILTD